MSKVRCIKVNFFSDTGRANNAVVDHREYDYMLVAKEDVRVGDYAVVKVGEIFKVVRIIQVMSRKSAKATKYAYTTFREDALDAAIMREAKITSLKEEIRERAEEARERQKLAELAAGDTQLTAMLSELTQLEAEANK